MAASHEGGYKHKQYQSHSFAARSDLTLLGRGLGLRRVIRIALVGMTAEYLCE
jgi:hypothetical protein